MGDYKEIFRLKEMLENAGMPFSFDPLCGGWHIRYPDTVSLGTVCSVIEHDYSYGSGADKLEIAGLLTKAEEKIDLVKGWLSAEEVFERIKKHWEKGQGKGVIYSVNSKNCN